MIKLSKPRIFKKNGRWGLERCGDHGKDLKASDYVTVLNFRDWLPPINRMQHDNLPRW